MSRPLRNSLQQAPWDFIPELAPARSHLTHIEQMAEEGYFDPGTLDALLTDMVSELQAVHRATDLERSLGAASRMLAQIEHHAASVWSRKQYGSYIAYPGSTIREVIARRAKSMSPPRPIPFDAIRAEVDYGSERPARTSAKRFEARPSQRRGPAVEDLAYDARALSTELPAATGERLMSEARPSTGHAGELVSEPTVSPHVQLSPTIDPGGPATEGLRDRTVAETGKSPVSPSLPLNGRELNKSIAPTWLALVVLSWVSLLWGGLISLPLGVGAAAIGGIFVVPLWGTIFGFMGMGRARASTLKEVGFQPCGPEVFLVQSCQRFAQSLGIKPPQVGSMDGFNAFAMGTDRDNATITLGRPLLAALTPQEAEAVLAHEIGHVVSGDMKRMMLMRTFQNATVWFMFAQGFKQFVRWVICWGAEFYILAFSRKREYWADAIGAALTSKEAMIGALKKLGDAPPLTDAENTHARFMVRGRISSAFSTHPSFEERIVALQHETYLRQLPRQRI